MAKNMFTHSRKGEIKDFYDIKGKELGRGASSVVMKANSKATKEEFAIKMITKTVSERKRFPFSPCAF